MGITMSEERDMQFGRMMETMAMEIGSLQSKILSTGSISTFFPQTQKEFNKYSSVSSNAGDGMEINFSSSRLSLPAELVVPEDVPPMDVKDVSTNISDCIHEFELEEKSDIFFAKLVILSMLLKSGVTTKKDVVVMFRNKNMEKAVDDMVKYFDGKYPEFFEDHEVIDISDKESVEAFHDLVDWEMEYIRNHISKAEEIKIQQGFKDIIDVISDIKGGIIDPIHTVSPDSVKMKIGFTDKEKEKLLKEMYMAFDRPLKDHIIDGRRYYTLVIMQETAELRVTDKDMTNIDRYRVDPGTIYGNGFNLIYFNNNPVTGNVDDVYVNVEKHPDIIEKIVADPGYIMTPQDLATCAVDSFINKNLYYYIDMPSFTKYISGMKVSNIAKLEKKLTAVTNVMLNPNPTPNSARLRLKEWKSLDNFTLISDGECRSPLAANNLTCQDIVPGFELSVLKNEIKASFFDQSGQKQTVKFGIVDN